MSNWINNYLIAKGISEMDLYAIDESGKHLDFNKIIPRPDELSLAEHVEPEIFMVFYYMIEHDLIDTIDTLADFDSRILNNKEIGLKIIEEAYKSIEGRRIDMDQFHPAPEVFKKETTFTKLRQLGQLLDNYLKYGYCTWYEWSIANWGTKWNASDTNFRTMDQISFSTAGNPPVPYLKKLSKKYRDVVFMLDYYDEEGKSFTMCFLGGVRQMPISL